IRDSKRERANDTPVPSKGDPMRSVRVRDVFRGLALASALAGVLLVSSANAEDEDLPDGARNSLAAISDGGTVTVFVKRGSISLRCIDTTGKKKPSYCIRRRVNCLAITPDGKFAVVGWDNLVSTVSLDPQAEVQRTRELESNVQAVAISPDGKTVAAVHESGRASLIDATSNKMLRTLKHDKAVLALRFSPGGPPLTLSPAAPPC